MIVYICINHGLRFNGSKYLARRIIAKYTGIRYYDKQLIQRYDGEAHSSVTYTRKNVCSVTKLYQSREIAKGKVKTNATYIDWSTPIVVCNYTVCSNAGVK